MANGFSSRVFGGLRNLLGPRTADKNEASSARPGAREFEPDSTFSPTASVPLQPDAPVQRAGSMRTPETKASADAFVATIRHLPLFSGTATQIVRSMDDEAVSGRDLARLISTDVGLVTHLLRIVNSPYFGFANRVVTVADALSVLGVDHVRRIVTASILQRPLMSYLHDTEAVRAFWRHELMCAALARHIAMRNGADGEAAYMAGLMHDVGRLAMVIEYPEHTDLLLPTQGDDHGSPDDEIDRFGFDHAEVGGALLSLWGLPPQIADAALHHADGSSPADPIPVCVWVANRLSYRMFDEPDDAESPWMTAIGLSIDGRRAILEEIRLLEAGRD